MIPRRTLFLLILLLITLPLALASAQDQEEEWLKVVQAAFRKAQTVETEREYAVMELTIQMQFRFMEDAPANGVRNTTHLTISTDRRLEDGISVLEVSDIQIDIGDMERFIGEVEDVYEISQTASIMFLQAARVAEEICVANVVADGPAADDMATMIESSLQEWQSRMEEMTLISDGIIEDSKGWLIGVTEHPMEQSATQDFRIFSLSIDPERYISELISTTDLLPPELNENDYLMEEFITDVKQNMQAIWKLWIGSEDGYIHRNKTQIRFSGAINGLDEPKLGFWMEITLDGGATIRYSDHNQLTDADFVLPCEPSASDITKPAPATPNSAGATPDRSR